MITVILGVALLATLALCLHVYSSGQRVRVQLATLISTIYIDGRHLSDFGTAYEAFCTRLPFDVGTGQRGALCAAFMERYAKQLSLMTPAMMFVGMTKATYEARKVDS